ncbi:RNA 2'-phosphotransferase [Xenorhabdus ishibashii]|uniref:RNA 2'-phosphotransferase n=1 Tax=Xenorhabdus ishibashii TaxID=1034471 RepID=A0A2D0KFD2_9GAMM|nr:RNA 2'-phosphotransferase [Xenorhabdus ishibashii]
MCIYRRKNPRRVKWGERHGKAIILNIEAQLMYEQGFKFHQADKNCTH